MARSWVWVCSVAQEPGKPALANLPPLPVSVPEPFPASAPCVARLYRGRLRELISYIAGYGRAPVPVVTSSRGAEIECRRSQHEAGSRSPPAPDAAKQPPPGAPPSVPVRAFSALAATSCGSGVARPAPASAWRTMKLPLARVCLYAGSGLVLLASGAHRMQDCLEERQKARHSQAAPAPGTRLTQVFCFYISPYEYCIRRGISQRCVVGGWSPFPGAQARGQQAAPALPRPAGQWGVQYLLFVVRLGRRSAAGPEVQQPGAHETLDGLQRERHYAAPHGLGSEVPT